LNLCCTASLRLATNAHSCNPCILRPHVARTHHSYPFSRAYQDTMRPFFPAVHRKKRGLIWPGHCVSFTHELDMYAAPREKRHSTFHSRCFSPRPQAGCCSQSAPRRSSGEQLLMQMVFASVVASVGSCHSNNDGPPHSPHGCLCAVSGSQLTATQSQHGQATHAQPPH
jgi:hypothetical protein